MRNFRIEIEECKCDLRKVKNSLYNALFLLACASFLVRPKHFLFTQHNIALKPIQNIFNGLFKHLLIQNYIRDSFFREKAIVS